MAEDLGPEQARAFVVGKLFSYTCFEGTSGVGRIFPDGSVVGTIRIRGDGPPRFAALPSGTIRVEGSSMCAHLAGMPIHAVFPGAEDRLPQLPRLAVRIGLRLLRLLPAQSARPDDHQRAERERPAATPVANMRPALRPSLQE